MIQVRKVRLALLFSLAEMQCGSLNGSLHVCRQGSEPQEEIRTKTCCRLTSSSTRKFIVSRVQTVQFGERVFSPIPGAQENLRCDYIETPLQSPRDYEDGLYS